MTITEQGTQALQELQDRLLREDKRILQFAIDYIIKTQADLTALAQAVKITCD